MVARIQQFFKQHQVKGPVLLGMSGGIDSMVLGHLLLETPIPFEVAHVNYGLRLTANEDASFVEDWCAQKYVSCHVRTVTKTERDGLSGSTQMWARSIRYDWFYELLNQRSLSHIILAHQQDDAVETHFINWIRGTGPRGYTIPMRSDDVLRPLLITSRSEIVAYAQAHNIHWREDESNQKHDYLRNRIRHLVIPQLKALNPGWDKTMGQNLRRLMGLQQLLAERIAYLEAKYLKAKSRHVVLDISWIRPDDSADELLLSELLQRYGVNYAQVKDLLRAKLSGKEVLAQDYTLTMDRAQIIIQPRRPSIDTAITWSNPELPVHFGGHQFTAITRKNWKIQADPCLATLDADLVQWPLQIDNWKEGDRFVPFGMDRMKKISDFMIDEKIPLSLKKNVPVVRSGNEICWVAGWRIDDRFKVTEQTRQVLLLRMDDEETI